jgi:protein SCO1/2
MHNLLWSLVIGAGIVILPGPLRGQFSQDIPAPAKEIGVDERLGQDIPLELQFTNEQGKTVRLSDIIDGRRPALITLNYSNCPGLCIAQLDGLVTGLGKLSGVQLGKDFDFISISIDPRDTPEKLARTKERYASLLDPSSHKKEGWHFLGADRANIDAISRALGFRFTYDAKADQYNHVAMAAAISPRGRITRYLYDVAFEPSTMRMSVIEASEGRVGTPLDAIVLWCMHFDPNANRYSADARKLLAIVAGGFVLILVVSMLPFWLIRSPTPSSSENASGGSLPIATTPSEHPPSATAEELFPASKSNEVVV